MRVTALAGGTGAAKLLRGLTAWLPARDLTIVGNTGDDAEIWGLHISPDLDTVTYALAGRLDLARGWGLAGDTFRCLQAMADLGAETWFNLGDRDLATHLARTRGLRGGATLTMVTADIAQRLGVVARIMPMSDDPVRTRVRTPDGWLSFQEYFVREKALVEALAVEYAGAARARLAPGVAEAIADADLIVVCPSNPVTSIGPMLAVPGLVEGLAARRSAVVAVSPIVGGAAVSGPAGPLMRAQGLPISSVGVAVAYGSWLGTLVIDEQDRALAPQLHALGVAAVVTDTLMTDREREIALAREVLSKGPTSQAPTRRNGCVLKRRT